MLPRATAVDAEPQYVECPRCGGERWLEDDERARPYRCPDCDSAGRIDLLNPGSHVFKHVKAFAFVFYNGIMLSIRSHADAVPQFIHCINMFHPMAIDCL